MSNIAERLRKQGELGLFALPADHQHVTFSEAANEIERLSRRLQVVDGWSEDADGIACRDDTIKLQDERIASLLARAEKAEAALREQIQWRNDQPPQDGSVIYGHTWFAYRWKAYKPTSEQVRRMGLKGRWQAMIDAAWEKHKAAAPCLRPPQGWLCSREPGHEGPCAAYPIKATPVQGEGE